MPRRKQSFRVCASIQINTDSLNELSKRARNIKIKAKKKALESIKDNWRGNISREFAVNFAEYANQFEGDNQPFMVENNPDVSGLNTKQWTVSRTAIDKYDSKNGVITYNLWLKNKQEPYPYTHVVEKKWGMVIYHNIVCNLAARRLAGDSGSRYYPKEDVPMNIVTQETPFGVIVDVKSAKRRMLRMHVGGDFGYDIFLPSFRLKGRTNKDYRSGIKDCAKRAFKKSIKAFYKRGETPKTKII